MIYNIIDDRPKGYHLVNVSDVSVFCNASTTAINSCIGYVCGAWESYCKTSLSASSSSGVYKGCTSDGNIYTKNIPIISVSNIFYKLVPNSEWTEINLGNVEIPNNTFINLWYDIYPDALYKIYYTAGFTVIPEDLKAITIQGTIDLLNQFGKTGSVPTLSVNSITKQEGTGSYTITYKDLWEKYKIVLDKYKNNNI